MVSSSSSAIPRMARNELDNLMEEAGDLVFRLDGGGRILFASTRATALLACPQELAGQLLASLVNEADQAALTATLADLASSQAVQRLDVRLATPDHEISFELRVSRYLAVGGALEMLVVGRDLTAQQLTEQRLRHQATHDALSDLPNRVLLGDRMRLLIAQARRTGQGFSVAAVGLDGFKKVNDSLGHAVGDAVLRLAATRLRTTLRDSDTLARVGGDEFVAMLPGTVSAAQIQLVTGRLIATLQTPFEVGTHQIYLSASVGVARYPAHAEDEVQLVALADSAMRRAKDTGGARCEVYSPRLGAPVHDMSLEAAMFQAVRDGEFLLFYQPIVDAQSWQIQGFEALMRWQHPTLGMVPPVRFIPITEGNGLINLLGAWALKAACMQLKQFEAAAGRALYMSVNISPRQFRSDKFLDVLDDALAVSGVAGNQLVLEITEGTLMIDPLHAQAVLGKMSQRQARIAIDDFGTGYSSLAYLKRFPISVLKIDRAFVKDLPASAKDGAICSTVLDLARHLDLSVVAEGVETAPQLAFLAQRGCQFIQGYLTGRPMPAHVALAALREATCTAVLAGRSGPGAA